MEVTASIEEPRPAEHSKTQVSTQPAENSVQSFREGQRARMARTLDRLLRTARHQASREATPSLIRLKWVNTVCYLTATYNSLLRDTEYDELKQEMNILQEKLRNLSHTKHQQPQTDNPTS